MSICIPLIPLYKPRQSI